MRISEKYKAMIKTAETHEISTCLQMWKAYTEKDFNEGVQKHLPPKYTWQKVKTYKERVIKLLQAELRKRNKV